MAAITRPTTVDAVYEEGVFKPRQPVHLEEKTCVRLVLTPPAAASERATREALDADPLMAMAGVDDFEPVPVDEIVYR